MRARLIKEMKKNNKKKGSHEICSNE